MSPNPLQNYHRFTAATRNRYMSISKYPNQSHFFSPAAAQTPPHPEGPRRSPTALASGQEHRMRQRQRRSFSSDSGGER
uniref:Uncharacterized protein n=1 Tax=Arundo donax TaxID=35708 RepID=A0A0A9GTS5_ARUDO